MELYAALPTTFYLVMVEIIVGTGVAMLLVEHRLEVGAGFLQFMGVSMGAVLTIAYFVAGDESRALTAIAEALALGYTVFAFAQRQRMRLALNVAFTIAASFALAVTIPSDAAMGPLIAVSVAAASLSLGASMTGMLLGHWYLVSPMLSSFPLLKVTGLFLVGLGAQIGLLAWMGAAGVAHFDVLPIVMAMRVAFGLVFPFVMAAFVWYSCRIRAMRTATGILYLAVGCVLMGDIAAKAYFFLTSVPV
ncbi:MAG: hypothetical protein EPO26_09960 [Chloroflexota bacterium]|nr:MAG: hypothetical protein EPO26_09960 [Chloroflexota bacterium]